jgi:hypothetical protein
VVLRLLTLLAIGMNTIRLLFSACVAVLCPQGQVFAQTSTNAPLGLSISFLGFTNNVRGDAAIFHFTNSAPHKLFFQVTGLEYLNDGAWKPAPPTQGARLQRTPDGSYRVLGGEMGWAAGVGFSLSLAASTAVTQQFDVHDTHAVWRIQAFCVEEATGLPGLVERGKEIIKKVQTGKNIEILSGRKYVATGQSARSNGQQDDASE